MGRSDTPSLHGRWGVIFRRSFKEFGRDHVQDRAAALTYFGILAVFPAILVLVSILGLIGRDATESLVTSVREVAPGGVADFVSGVVEQVQGRPATAGIFAIAGALVALWSASGYVAAFMRASNAIYDVPEGRPWWKTVPLRLAVTLAVVVLLVLAVVIVVITGPVADAVGRMIGVGDGLRSVWTYAKWPVLLIIVALLLSLLFTASPNVKQGRFRMLTAGGVIAVVLWLVVSGAFGVYVAFSGSYNKTYGPLSTAIVFLVWLYLSNMAVLLGLEFDAEGARERAALAGAPREVEPYVHVRDTRSMEPRERAQVAAAEAVLPNLPETDRSES